MKLQQVYAVLRSVNLPKGWKFEVAYPVKWKDYKKYYPGTKYKDYLDYAMASTDQVEKTIYITPYYVKYFTPMTLMLTILHELGHVHQISNEGGHHSKIWYEAATDNLFTLEDEYIAKRAISERIHKPKTFNKNMKKWLHSQQIKYGYYVPKRFR